MRIAVISSQVFPCPPIGYAGLEMIAYHCAAGLVKKGHDVTLIAPEGSLCPGGKILTTGAPNRVNEWDAFQSYKEVLPSFDCIVDHSWMKASYLLKHPQGTIKCPVLGVMHAPVDTMYKTLPPNVDKPCFVAISVDQANHFKALYGKVDCRVAYNGIDLEYYKPLDIPRSDRFLFLARFSTIKGPDIAIEACLKAGVGLDLVGDTSITNEPELLQKCKSMADGKQIRIIGGVSRGECVWWFSQAHTLLHPNKHFREPFGLAPLEANACGCPVIAWDYGAMRETMGTGVISGNYLVRSEEELHQRIKSQKTDVNGSDRHYCQDNAKRFSIENMVEGYDRLCNEAVKTGGW